MRLAAAAAAAIAPARVPRRARAPRRAPLARPLAPPPAPTTAARPRPSQAMLTPGAERLYAALHATPCTWVDSESTLSAMRKALAAASEIAIDLEQHSYRTYRGFVCLMQISTRE